MRSEAGDASPAESSEVGCQERCGQCYTNHWHVLLLAEYLGWKIHLCRILAGTMVLKLSNSWGSFPLFLGDFSISIHRQSGWKQRIPRSFKKLCCEQNWSSHVEGNLWWILMVTPLVPAKLPLTAVMARAVHQHTTLIGSSNVGLGKLLGINCSGMFFTHRDPGNRTLQLVLPYVHLLDFKGISSPLINLVKTNGKTVPGC